MNSATFWKNLEKLKNEDIDNYSHYLKSDCRSSTIFPVYKNYETVTKIEFLSYWKKKHNNKVVIKYTNRNLKGEILNVHYESIIKYKAVSFLASKYFNNAIDGFVGSVEIEVYSEFPPLFTFPALTLSISNAECSSVVHSCIRTYNANEKIKDYAIGYPQSGFDVSFNLKNKNYICFIGAYKKRYNLLIQLSENQKFKEKSIFIENQSYGQTHIVFLEELFSDEIIKMFNKPKCIIRHDLDDIFPRFYVGIINNFSFPTLTHTFYDTSSALETNQELDARKLRAVNENPIKYFDSSVMIPIYSTEKYNTSIKSYAQNLNFSGLGLIKIFSPEGSELFSRAMGKTEINKLNGLSELDLDELMKKNNYPNNKPCSILLGFVDKLSPFPSRFKLGLNIKKVDSKYGSNICFAPQVMSQKTLSKPFSRRWFPIGGDKNFIASVHNTKLLMNDNSSISKFILEFVNFNGDIMTRDYNLKPNSSIFLDLEDDQELKNFFNEQVGWCMVNAETCFIDAYYISTSGVQIGGDHAF